MNDADVRVRVYQLKLEGKRCAPILMSIVGNEVRGEDNQELVRAVSGLSYGLGCQDICGALSSGVCALSLYGADQCLNQELIDWFESEFAAINCRDIVGLGNLPNERCLDIVTKTTKQCLDILEDNGYL